ncbi:TetR/AcrR family transcriptional regulator [Nocardia brevicatena]|uniref:TetR/AcrR family transcriptional regulator n=1 Tax=Nocardia brevicatena TaxID=37327 RepID=UPI0003078A6D|nr:TetR family transcriptional regulator C-terminal domain-containing protein [Nocardia brevicatena]
MPKVVDREQRRDEVVAALWRLAYRDGWDAVSLRKVASEAGLSLGSVQHYFAGLDDLLDHAVAGVLDILDERLVGQLTMLTDPRCAESTVRRVLQSMIPGAVDESPPAVTSVPDALWQAKVMAWLTVVERAARRPEMSARLSAGSDRLTRAIAAAIRICIPDRSHSEAEHDARGLLALVEGLLVQLVRRDLVPADASTVIERFVSGVFTPHAAR